jgi:UDP-N-acetylmuramoyl-tripeptide--D-alanyl-D-alanine ligase
LQFRVHVSGKVFPVQTRLVGAHWLHCVLPALAIAQEAEIPAATAAAAIAEAEPFTARLSPAAAPSGAIILRDEYNGSLATFHAALTVIREASAARKILVISDVADSGEHSRSRMARIGSNAAEVFDSAIFIGETSKRAEKAAVRAGMPPHLVHSFGSAQAAAEFLRTELRAGDLVLLRGRHSDHLSRVWLALVKDVTCWQISCGRRGLCDDCGELVRPV